MSASWALALQPFPHLSSAIVNPVYVMVEDAFDATVSLVYEAAASPSGWPAAMRGIADFVGAQRAARITFAPATGKLLAITSIGCDERAHQQYASYYADLYPGKLIILKAPVGEWHGDAELLDERAASQQDFIRDFAYPNGMGCVGGAKLHEDDAQAIFLSLHREPGGQSFAAVGRDAFCKLLPHMLRAERLRLCIATLVSESDIAHAMLNQFGTAVLALSADRKLQEANRFGQRLLRESTAVHVSHGKLKFSSPEADQRLVAAVARALPPQRRESAFLVAEAGRHQAIQVLVLPLTSRSAFTSSSDQPLALVILADVRVTPPSAVLYGQLYDLTAAESALIQAVGCGTPVGQWAVERGVAVSTARSQLAAVMQKTGCSTQQQLICLLHALPSLDAERTASQPAQKPAG